MRTKEVWSLITRARTIRTIRVHAILA